MESIHNYPTFHALFVGGAFVVGRAFSFQWVGWMVWWVRVRGLSGDGAEFWSLKRVPKAKVLLYIISLWDVIGSTQYEPMKYHNGMLCKCMHSNRNFKRIGTPFYNEPKIVIP